MNLDGRAGAALNTSGMIISHEILALIAGIDEFKGAWRGLARITPERLSRWRRRATLEGIGASTRLDGSGLNDREVARVLGGIGSLETDDERDVAGTARVMEGVWSNWRTIDLGEGPIKRLHHELLRYRDARHRGEYKTLPNRVEAFGPDGESLGFVFRTATPAETPGFMAELVGWTRTQFREGPLHPLLAVAVFVAAFLAINPFTEGNGRLSRILTTLLLLRSGYAYVPYAALEGVFENSRDAYPRALRQTQATLRTDRPNWQPWIDYFLGALREHKNRLEKTIQRERSVLADLPQLSVMILDLAHDRGRLTVADAARLTGASRNTIKDHARDLAGKGLLTRHGAGRGSWYAP